MQKKAKALGITDINVLKRLCTLRRTLDYLKGTDDKEGEEDEGLENEYKLVKTVEAIINAYKKGNLDGMMVL